MTEITQTYTLVKNVVTDSYEGVITSNTDEPLPIATPAGEPLETTDAMFAPFDPVGAHAQASPVSSTTLTPPSGATRLMLQTETQDVRYTLDGTVPTTTKGFTLVKATGPVILHVATGHVVKIIEVASAATVDYQWLA